jgi:type II secretory ATPase GspE/PulE/Tfp pilus assembly ATPase PilB-like protein
MDGLETRQSLQATLSALSEGQTVIATLVASQATEALSALEALGVPPWVAASFLRGVVAQRLLRRLCPHCSIEVAPTPEEQAQHRAVTGKALEQLALGMGCAQCRGTGYLDRVAVFEVLAVEGPLHQSLAHGARGEALRALAVAEGMVPLRPNGMRKVRAGLTAIQEVLRETPP